MRNAIRGLTCSFLFASGIVITAGAPDAMRDADLLFRAGKYVEAATTYEGLVSGQPACAECWLRLGLSRFEIGKTKEAETALRKHLELEPFSAEGRTGLGRVLFEEARYPEATKELEAAFKLDRTEVDALKTLVRIRLIEKDYERALALLTPIAQSPAVDSEARMLSAYALEKQGNLERAVRILERGIAIVTWGGDAAFAAAARARVKLGDYERAATICERGLDIEPNSERLDRIYLSLPIDLVAGKIKGRLSGMPDESRSVAQRIFLGRLLTSIDERAVPSARETAGRLLMEAAAREPANASAQYNVGRFLRLTGRLTESKAAFQKALTLDPDETLRVLILAQLAQAEDGMGAAAEAEKDFQTSFELNRRASTQNPDAAFEYVSFLRRLSRDAEAKRLLNVISRWDIGAVEEFLATSQSTPGSVNP